MKDTSLSILLVEDDLLTLATNKRILARYGEVLTAPTYAEAQQLLSEGQFDIAFFDLNLHGTLSGLDLIKIASDKSLYTVVVSGESRGDILETAFKNGAKDYLLKPFNDEKLLQVLNRFLNNRKHLSFETLINDSFITKSPEQIEELYKIKNLTISEKPIFINGETGTGKRVVAHIIKSICINKKFIEVNCSQFSDELIASELFGHAKGAFTGAAEKKDGLLVQADGGIIFLDEIHALSLKSQKTLLKAIEEKEFYPVGSDRPVKSNFRVVSATCENIHELIQDGKFREDLFARISTFQINLLPLRNRIEDINLLFTHFISKHLVQVFINDEAMSVLQKYSWPRNTREIEDLVENWIVNGHRLITPDILPLHIKQNTSSQGKFIPDVYLDMAEEHGLNDFLTFLKKEIALGIIKRNGDSLRKAASSMGASYSNLSNFLKTNKELNLCEGRKV
jgi:DNA-binding NtrC family response regulator